MTLKGKNSDDLIGSVQHAECHEHISHFFHLTQLTDIYIRQTLGNKPTPQDFVDTSFEWLAALGVMMSALINSPVNIHGDIIMYKWRPDGVVRNVSQLTDADSTDDIEQIRWAIPDYQEGVVDAGRLSDALHYFLFRKHEVYKKFPSDKGEA